VDIFISHVCQQHWNGQYILECCAEANLVIFIIHFLNDGNILFVTLENWFICLLFMCCFATILLNATVLKKRNKEKVIHIQNSLANLKRLLRDSAQSENNELFFPK
jgi:hypothetical protein